MQLVESTRPDLILLDVSLRGTMDGVATASELQRNGIDTPIVFVTAYGSGEAVRRAQAVCFSGYLTKPFRSEQLRDAIHTALERHSGSQVEALLLHT